MNSVVFTIPNLRIQSESNAPNRTLRANRISWARRTSQKGIVSGHTLAEWNSRLTSQRPKPPWTVMLTRIAPRPLDQGNLEASFKAAQDGVAAALGMDDRDIRWVYRQERGGVREYGLRVKIETTEKRNGND